MIILSVLLFIILNVWQNIEVMKLKLDLRKALKIEKKFIKQNDRIRYEIERFKRMDVIEKYAEERGMKRITPDDFQTIMIKKKDVYPQ